MLHSSKLIHRLNIIHPYSSQVHVPCFPLQSPHPSSLKSSRTEDFASLSDLLILEPNGIVSHGLRLDLGSLLARSSFLVIGV